jgi:retron-type reverse transcriptase
VRLTKQEIAIIKKKFSSIQSKEDFLVLLNRVKKTRYGEAVIPFKMTQLNYHINSKLNPNRYTHFEIRKKTGGYRNICAPCAGLKQIQYCLNSIFQALYTPHHNAYGFLPEKSIVDNAKVHVGSLYVYNIDIKDFFPSIDQARVWGRLKNPPFCLDEKHNRLEIANMIASLCCHEMEVERLNGQGTFEKVRRRVLPQGAPTSPMLTNIICERLDYLLSAVAKRFGLKYSRYADDITFSSMHNVYQEDSPFLKELHRIITDQHFDINPAKTRLQKQGFRQEVTGLIINDKVNVTKRYIKQIRMWLYYWETYGYDRAYLYFYPRYLEDKGHIKKGKPNMATILAGKLEYLKMVKGNNNPTYLKLKERFEKLTQQESSNIVRSTLDIWEKEGIEKAMEFYYGTIMSDNSLTSATLSS